MLERVFSSSPALQEKLSGLPEDHLAKLAERIKNLEIYETNNYVFMLPKDKWEEDKTKLPPNDEATFIAPNNLTAILKAPVEPVYGEEWVGKEIHHFPWSEELLEANEALLKPNGYRIPIYWNDITDAIEQTQGPEGEKQSEYMRDELGLTLSGFIWDNKPYYVGEHGCYWSSKPLAKDNPICLALDHEKVSPVCGTANRRYAIAVRCVSGRGGNSL